MFSGEGHLDELLTILETCDYVSIVRTCKTHKTIWNNLHQNSTVKKLLQRKRIERNINEVNQYLRANGQDLKQAFSKVILDEKAYLIEDFISQGINSKLYLNDLLLLTCKKGHLEALNLILSAADSKKFEQQVALAFACDNNQLPVVTRLLLDNRFDPAAVDNIALEAACGKGYIDIVNTLLSDSRVDAKISQNLVAQITSRPFYGLQQAVHNGHLSVVNRLLADSRFCPTKDDNVYIRVACQEGHLEIVNRLLKEPDVNPSAKSNHALNLACRNGHLKIVKRLLADSRTVFIGNVEYQNEALLNACQNGHWRIVELLLNTPQFKVSNADSVITVAVEKGWTKIVQLLLNKGQFSPSNNIKYLLMVTCEKGYFEIFKLLYQPPLSPELITIVLSIAARHNRFKILKTVLQNGTISPVVDNNYPIHVACEKGYLEIFCMLLADSRIDPTFKDNVLLRCAVENNQPKIVKALVDDDRVLLSQPPVNQNSHCFQVACEKGYYQIVKLLLPASDINYNNAFLLACQSDRFEIVKLLLKDSRINPGCEKNRALINACARGSLEMVNLLLSHAQVNPSDKNNAPIIWASKKGHVEVVQRLLQDARVDPSGKNNHAIKLANTKGKFEVMKILFGDQRVYNSLSLEKIVKYKNAIDCNSTNAELRHACLTNDYQSFKNLMKYSKTCKPEAYRNSALSIVCETGNIRFVQRLLKHPSVNPADDRNWPLRMACYKGHTEIVKLLLKDSRVSPIDKRNNCIRNAHCYKHNEVVKILLQDERVLTSLTESEVNNYLRFVTK